MADVEREAEWVTSVLVCAMRHPTAMADAAILACYGWAHDRGVTLRPRAVAPTTADGLGGGRAEDSRGRDGRTPSPATGMADS